MNIKKFLVSKLGILLLATSVLSLGYAFFAHPHPSVQTLDQASSTSERKSVSQATSQFLTDQIKAEKNSGEYQIGDPIDKFAIWEGEGFYVGDVSTYVIVSSVEGSNKSHWNMKIVGKTNGGYNANCSSRYDMPVCYFFAEPKGANGLPNGKARLVATTSGKFNGGVVAESLAGFIDNDNFRFVSESGDGGGSFAKEINLYIPNGEMTMIYTESTEDGALESTTAYGVPVLMQKKVVGSK